jgi:hypothetical protein
LADDDSEPTVRILVSPLLELNSKTVQRSPAMFGALNFVTPPLKLLWYTLTEAFDLYKRMLLGLPALSKL